MKPKAKSRELRDIIKSRNIMAGGTRSQVRQSSITRISKSSPSRAISIVSTALIVIFSAHLIEANSSQSPESASSSSRGDSNRTALELAHKTAAAATNPKQSTARSQRLLGRARQRNDAVELAKKHGQLESFSMEATGLGDLEEADAIRIMMRRSWEHQRHIDSIKGDLSARGQQDKNEDETGAAAQALIVRKPGLWPRANRPYPRGRTPTTRFHDNDEPILRLLLNKRRAEAVGEALARPPGQEMPPIEIRRRTTEELYEDNSEDKLAAEQSSSDDLDDKKLGEFSSRISLLTMRKIQPEEMLLNRALAAGYEMMPPPRDGARGPLASVTREQLIEILSGAGAANANAPDAARLQRRPPGDSQSIWINTDNSNYLPRVARGGGFM